MEPYFLDEGKHGSIFPSLPPTTEPPLRPFSLLAAFGERLKRAREAAGLSLEETARRAGLSTRYLRMAEAGEANLSLLKIAALAGALDRPLRELCDLHVASPPELRLALVGLRGAGKSSVGRVLARILEVPFVELDAEIERHAGLTLAQIFGIHGEDEYRALQREALEEWLSRAGRGVLAPGGSLVEDEGTWSRLRATCRTVWLRASPEDHWNRVVAQGDLRPMSGQPRAQARLQALLAEREPRYALADLTVDTTGRTPEAIADEIARWVLA